MSIREKCDALMDKLDDKQLAYILALLEEAADDAYCEELYQNYLNDPDPDKGQMFSLEECKQEWGIA